MHADPTDRIISADGPEISPVSVPRIFAVGLVLPFAHPIRLILSSILPALILALGIGPIERIVTALQSLGIGQPGGIGAGTTTTTPPMLPQAVGVDFLKVYGLLFLALALWLCAWQRAAARGFSEPLLRWLGRSLLRFPGYVLALAVWTLTPSIVMLVPLMALGALVSRNLGGVPGTTPQDAIARMNATWALFSTLQWWVVGIALLVIALIALWLSARLSPLPPLVARQGWRRSFGRAWGLSRGHGFGLSVSLFAYALLSFLVLMVAAITFGTVMYTRARAGILDPTVGILFGVIANLAVSALVVIWHASLGALVVRDGLSPAEALDPAMFD